MGGVCAREGLSERHNRLMQIYGISEAPNGSLLLSTFFNQNVQFSAKSSKELLFFMFFNEKLKFSKFKMAATRHFSKILTKIAATRHFSKILTKMAAVASAVGSKIILKMPVNA